MLRLLAPVVVAQLRRRGPGLAALLLETPVVTQTLQRLAQDRRLRVAAVAAFEAEVRSPSVLLRVLPADPDTRDALLYVLRGATVARLLRSSAAWDVLADRDALAALLALRSTPSCELAQAVRLACMQHRPLDRLLRQLVWASPSHRSLLAVLLADLRAAPQHTAVLLPTLLHPVVASEDAERLLSDQQLWDILLDWTLWPYLGAWNARTCAALDQLQAVVQRHASAARVLIHMAPGRTWSEWLLRWLAGRNVTVALALLRHLRCRRGGIQSRL